MASESLSAPSTSPKPASIDRLAPVPQPTSSTRQSFFSIGGKYLSITRAMISLLARHHQWVSSTDAINLYSSGSNAVLRHPRSSTSQYMISIRTEIRDLQLPGFRGLSSRGIDDSLPASALADPQGQSHAARVPVLRFVVPADHRAALDRHALRLVDGENARAFEERAPAPLDGLRLGRFERGISRVLQIHRLL